MGLLAIKLHNGYWHSGEMDRAITKYRNNKVNFYLQKFYRHFPGITSHLGATIGANKGIFEEIGRRKMYAQHGYTRIRYIIMIYKHF